MDVLAIKKNIKEKICEFVVRILRRAVRKILKFRRVVVKNGARSNIWRKTNLKKRNYKHGGSLLGSEEDLDQYLERRNVKLSLLSLVKIDSFEEDIADNGLHRRSSLSVVKQRRNALNEKETNDVYLLRAIILQHNLRQCNLI